MTTPQGQALHDRLTRGERLTLDEQQILDAWYREQDQAESALIEQQVLPTDITVLRTQLEVSIKQLALVSQRINEVMLVNDELRRDIARLQAQLAPQIYGHAA